MILLIHKIKRESLGIKNMIAELKNSKEELEGKVEESFQEVNQKDKE